MVNHRVLPVQSQALYPELGQFPFPNALAHQEIGQNGNTQPCLYTLQDDLVAGALPYGADIQLLCGQYTVKYLPAGASLFPQNKILIPYLCQLLQGPSGKFMTGRTYEGQPVPCKALAQDKGAVGYPLYDSHIDFIVQYLLFNGS